MQDTQSVYTQRSVVKYLIHQFVWALEHLRILSLLDCSFHCCYCVVQTQVKNWWLSKPISLTCLICRQWLKGRRRIPRGDLSYCRASVTAFFDLFDIIGWFLSTHHLLHILHTSSTLQIMSVVLNHWLTWLRWIMSIVVNMQVPSFLLYILYSLQYAWYSLWYYVQCVWYPPYMLELVWYRYRKWQRFISACPQKDVPCACPQEDVPPTGTTGT